MTGATAPWPVVIVDDSPVQRRMLRAAIEVGGHLTVIGEAGDGHAAVALVARLRPRAVVMDLDLPVMSGLEAIERIMALHPTPIVVCSAFVGDGGGDVAAALAAGAVDVIGKPGPDAEAPGRYAAELRRRLHLAGRARVITHPRGRLRNVPAVTRPVGGGGPHPAGPGTDVCSGAPTLIAIGASTGGPAALSAVLADLPADLPAPVLVVQHMADGFLEDLTRWLDRHVPLRVRLGMPGEVLTPGTVAFAPGGANLVVSDQRRIRRQPAAEDQLHVPSIDVMFRSVGRAFGPSAIGVLLTGMGRDGAAGLKEMRDRGSFTLAQDEASCAVYGMPGAAVALGAVQAVSPLAGIAPLLLGRCGLAVPA